MTVPRTELPVALQQVPTAGSAHELLRKTEERLRLATEVARIALWDWDLAADEIYLNREWAAMVGREPVPYVASAQELADRMHPQDATRIRRAIFKAQAEDDTCEAIYRIRTDQGGYRWVRSQGRVVTRDDQGKALRMIGMYIDITESKRIEDELREARDAAGAADRSKVRFLQRMSHELRTPLNGVLGMAQLLGLTALDAHQSKLLEVINQSGQSLLGLIDDVLEFSRLGQGQITLQPRSFDPARVASEALARAEHRLPRSGAVTLELQLRPGLPQEWTGDAERIGQVLQHLLANAIKFTVAGEVKLSVGPLFATATQLGLQFEVSDTGAGIAADQLQHLFAVFEQLDGSSTRPVGGAGLGLALVNELVQLMGGSVDVVSTPGRGSVFAVRLPSLTAQTSAGRV